MFERYTDKARRAIFFARYEASQYGFSFIETEHLLLGVIREDKELRKLFFPSEDELHCIRNKIDEHKLARKAVSTSVDIPISNESKRVLNYAVEESERVGNKNINTEHIFLGLLREEKCFAAELLSEQGVNIDKARSDLTRIKGADKEPNDLEEIKDLFYDYGFEFLRKYDENLLEAYRRGYENGKASK